MAEGGAAIHAARGLRVEQVATLSLRQVRHHLLPVALPLLHRPVWDRAPAAQGTPLIGHASAAHGLACPTTGGQKVSPLYSGVLGPCVPERSTSLFRGQPATGATALFTHLE